MTKTKSQYSHSIPGIVWFNIPLALLLSFLFHLVVRPPLINHLPRALFLRFARYRDFDWLFYVRLHWLVVLVSIFLGVISHLAWDWFTHHAIPRIQQMPDVGFTIFSKYFHIPIYLLFHSLNSLLGGLVLFFYIRIIPEQRSAKRKDAVKWYWHCLLLITIILTAFRIVWDPGLLMQTYITSFFSALLIACTVTSAFVIYLHRNR